MQISKQFEAAFEAPTTIAPEILAKINRLAPEPVPADQIYFAWATLADDKLDRSFEQFPKYYLDRFAETIVGKSLLPGHDRSAVPIGRWIAGIVQPTTDGGHELKAGFYLPIKSDLATRVRMGIANFVSIGFQAAGRTCDLCGEPYDGVKGCEHQKGQTYDGRVCTVTYSGDAQRVEAREGSLVWLPCQPAAQVTGAKADGVPYGGHVLSIDTTEEKHMTKEEETALLAKVAEQEDEIKRLKQLETKAADGDAYHKSLKAQIARNMAGVKGTPHDDQHPDPEVTMIMKTLEGANTETLQAWDKLWQDRFDEKFPPQPQSKMLGAGALLAPVGAPAQPPQPFDPHASLKRGY